MPTPKIDLFDLVACLSDTVDLVSPVVADHHKRVAYIALHLGLEIGLAGDERQDLILAAALHDIGALSLRERLDALHFEAVEPRHAESGYRLLHDFGPLAPAAELIRFHHVPWNHGAGRQAHGFAVPRAAHLLHLADRIDASFKELPTADTSRQADPLAVADHVLRRIRAQSGGMFVPEMVDAFRSLAEKEYFWFDLASPEVGSVVARHVEPLLISPADRGSDLVRLIAQIIDFKSPFTATHSAGVAAAARTLARLYGFPKEKLMAMQVAGCLHDLGKLAVPPEILEKPATLTPGEFSIIKSHAYHTHRVLSKYRHFRDIIPWAAFHHERLDGRGYPFRLAEKQLSPGARIMAAADVFTALTEDRPYRPAMKPEQVRRVLRNMEGTALDPEITALVKQNYEELTVIRQTTQEKAAARYRAFRTNLSYPQSYPPHPQPTTKKCKRSRRKSPWKAWYN